MSKGFGLPAKVIRRLDANRRMPAHNQIHNASQTHARCVFVAWFKGQYNVLGAILLRCVDMQHQVEVRRDEAEFGLADKRVNLVLSVRTFNAGQIDRHEFF